MRRVLAFLVECNPTLGYSVWMSDGKVDIGALARLARIEVAPEELARLEKEIPGILRFIETIQSVDTSSTSMPKGLRNVMRADEAPHESGAHTEKLLSAAPMREGDRIAVKQVISRKKK